MRLAFLLHQTLCGAIAAAGFGILFNFSFTSLPWCALSGAVALAVRTCCLSQGWSVEAASLAAALTVGFGTELLRNRSEDSRSALDVVGCIPMVPGSLAAKAILSLIALTTSSMVQNSETLVAAAQYSVSTIFTIGAIGTGLVIPTVLLHLRLSRRRR